MTFIDVLLKIIVPILSGIATAIPLIIKLVQVIKEAAKSKNWTNLIKLVLQLMTDAEKNFSTGAERKQYVVDAVKAVEHTLNYDINEDVLNEIIDSIVDASKTINVNKK